MIPSNDFKFFTRRSMYKSHCRNSTSPLITFLCTHSESKLQGPFRNIQFNWVNVKAGGNGGGGGTQISHFEFLLRFWVVT